MIQNYAKAHKYFLFKTILSHLNLFARTKKKRIIIIKIEIQESHKFKSVTRISF